MLYFVNGSLRLLFSEKSISDNVKEVKESTICKETGKRLAA